MTTTEMIELLRQYEFGGATGEPREINFELPVKSRKSKFLSTPKITVAGTGDGMVTDITLRLEIIE